MKHFQILLILLILLFDSSCKENPHNREMIPYPEKYEHDGYSQLPDSLKPVFIPDTSIGGISLMNSENISEYLGDDVLDKLNQNALFSVEVLSNDRNQRMKVYFHTTADRADISGFEIKYNDGSGRELQTSRESEFKTENGIKLGISIGDLRAIKGEPDSVVFDETSIYLYKIDESNGSGFLERYNVPQYNAVYEFDNGYLIRFRFGFENP
ncbi:hypothetical protein JXL83_01010 [candidate division WOR-3 bacterium]|nr:hypothetical protein [candidate division WOR-3 bacterium]